MTGRRAATLLTVAGLLVGLAAQQAGAHAGLTTSDPVPGAELGASPETVRLSFSEQPQASLSTISVLDSSGTPQQSGDTQPVGGDPLSLSVPVPRLGRGVYTVSYRVVSAVDGHATAGAYAFGIRVSPTGVAATATTASPATSALEVIARWLLLLGLVALIGAAVAGAAGFGGPRGTDLILAAAGWLASVAGLVLLAVAQRRTAGSSLGDLLDTSVGSALVWRAVALAAAGAALLVARRRPRVRRWALVAAAIAAIAAIAVHVGAGHAAAGGWPAGLTVTTQVAHFAAAGIWFGGLAALLLGIRGAPSATKAAAVRRFAVVAAAALVVVFVTGTVRAVDELSSWGDLFDTGYGRAVLAKLVLIAIIFGLAARNRRRSVPTAETDLGPLRRTSQVELVLAIGALGVAALLGTLAPPVSGQSAATTGLSTSGSDFGTTVEVTLTAVSDEPGPNRFVADVVDHDSGDPVDAGRVSLTFTPLDDPGVAASTLELKRVGDGSYAGSGANMAFDGRWGVAALIERGGDSVEVPLELDLPVAEPIPSVVRIPGEPPQYTIGVEFGLIRITPDPELAGPSKVYVRLYEGAEDLPAPTDQVVVTGAAGDGPAEQKPVTRLTRSRFVADIDLVAGPYTITVVAHRPDGARTRGAVELDVPAG
ncbi:MAG: copper transport protein [Solirubrobacterales bacterium]|nr:copper transport protein [Solirubrobacterales bacterium]